MKKEFKNELFKQELKESFIRPKKQISEQASCCNSCPGGE